jgi:ribulose 1,5-bisphosphate synthetase/thiazole synthase
VSLLKAVQAEEICSDSKDGYKVTESIYHFADANFLVSGILMWAVPGSKVQPLILVKDLIRTKRGEFVARGVAPDTQSELADFCVTPEQLRQLSALKMLAAYIQGHGFKVSGAPQPLTGDWQCSAN